MCAPEIEETRGFNHCQGCGAAQIDRDKFCRRCGVSQSRGVGLSNYKTDSGAVAAVAHGYATAPLSGGAAPRRPYSGQLINIMTQQLSEQTASFHANRRAMLLIGILVAAPLWLMIVLLSPLDAYVAAKDLAKQV
ncbi:MAG TPA: hypothetical protein VI479_00540 [Blastocatellia bacterium]